MNSTQSTSSAAVSGSRRMFTTRELVIGGMFAALLAVISQLSIPMPSGVPITIQILGVALVGSVLGWRLGLFATITYILIGAVGLPVFANFSGGFSKLVGVTGGYIWSWPFLAALAGVHPHWQQNQRFCSQRDLRPDRTCYLRDHRRTSVGSVSRRQIRFCHFRLRHRGIYPEGHRSDCHCSCHRNNRPQDFALFHFIRIGNCSVPSQLQQKSIPDRLRR